MRNKRAVSLLLVICMICCVLFLFAGCSGDSDVAEIRDSALRNKLTELLGKDAGEDILISELNDFNGYIDLSDTNVKNLEGRCGFPSDLTPENALGQWSRKNRCRR